MPHPNPSAARRTDSTWWDVSERRTSDRPDGGPLSGPAAVSDPCGIRRALSGVVDAPWPDFFSQWCWATAMGPVAAGHVRDVAARLARPAAGADDPLPRAWAAVRDALAAPSLEATA